MAFRAVTRWIDEVHGASHDQGIVIKLKRIIWLALFVYPMLSWRAGFAADETSCPDKACAMRKAKLIKLREQLCSAERDRQSAKASIREEWDYARQSGVVDVATLATAREELREADAERGGRANEWRIGDEWKQMTGKVFNPKICVPLKPLAVPTRLSKDPPPPAANLAGDIHRWEAKLAASDGYKTLWSAGHEADRDLFLSGLAQVIARSAFSGSVRDRLHEHQDIMDAIVSLYLIVIRTGHLPRDFDAHIRTHLDSIKAMPHLGVWATGENGYDYAGLAAWLNPTSLEYFREFLTSRTDVPNGGWDADSEKPSGWLKYLTDERVAIARYQTLLFLASKNGRVATDDDCDVVGLELHPPEGRKVSLCR